MRAANLDIFIEQGTVFGMTLNLQASEGVPKDLTGYSFAGQIRAAYSDTSVLAVLSCTTNVDPTDGVVNVNLTDVQTSNLPADPATSYQKRNTFFCYDIEMRRPDGSHIRILQGSVELSPEVTR